MALAYVSLRAHAGVGSGEEEETAAFGRALAGFASREGYALGGVFTDVRSHTESGLNALLEAIQRGDAVAVVVPDLDHLRHVGCLTGADLPTAGRYLRARLLAMATHEFRIPGLNEQHDQQLNRRPGGRAQLGVHRLGSTETPSAALVRTGERP